MWWLTHARASPGQAERVLELGAAGQQRARACRRRAATRPRARSRASGGGHCAPRDRAHAPSRRCGSRSGGRGPGTGRRSAPAARARRRRGRRSARRRRCRWSSRASSPTSASSRWCSGEYGSITPSSGAPGATDAGDRRIGAPRGEHDRALGRRQQRPLGASSDTSDSAPRQRRRHQRERLVLAVLARPQRRHRRLVVGAAGEVIAADALDRDDRAGAQRGRGGGDRIARRIGSRSLRAAAPTARTPGTRWAGRGSAGRPGPRTRPGRPGTS